MLFILGESATGKDTLVKSLIKDHGFKRIITYTTRPMRPGEIQDVTYHFISEEDFLDKKDKGFFLECRDYSTVKGNWYYGSALVDFIKYKHGKTVIILNPEGYLNLIHKIGKRNIDMAICLTSSEELRRKRLDERGDDINEVNRRIMADKKDFTERIMKQMDLIIPNEEENKIDEIAKRINEYYEQKEKGR